MMGLLIAAQGAALGDAPEHRVAGITLLGVSKTTSTPVVGVGGTVEYTITVTNTGELPVTLTSILDALPPGFSYVGGSTTGITTADPGIAGQDLTWSGQFEVRAASQVLLAFHATASSIPGDYLNNASATAVNASVEPSGPTAQVEVTCDDGFPCTVDGPAPEGSCDHTPDDAACDDVNPCTDDLCNLELGCVNPANAAPCDDGNPCTSDDACADGTCVGGPGPECDDQNPCTDDSCDPEGGCRHASNTLPCDDGDACTTDEKCTDGTCVGGSGPDCDDQNPCTDDSCDPEGGCRHASNTLPCDDGDACTTDDKCTDGECVGGPGPDCDDQNSCTDDSCDIKGGCTHVNNSSPCDDGDACTTGDACADGTCVGGPGPDCDDQNPCTDDSCDPEGGCRHASNTLPCDDGDACTTGDTCADGTCVGGAGPECDDQNACTDDSCDPEGGCRHASNTLPCDDGDACTTGDACADGTCVGGPGPECDDQNSCTDDSCDVKGGCTHVNNSSPCDDGDACSTGDACADGTCVGGPGPDCDDQNSCTDDSCDIKGGCTHVNNSSPCDDGDACSTGDACADGTCVGGPGPECDDQNSCTDDSCDVKGGCTHVDNSSPCDDGSACTTGDACADGACVGGPVVCTASDPCHVPGTCDPSTGQCSSPVAPDGTACDDGDACTRSDACEAGFCTGSNPDPACGVASGRMTGGGRVSSQERVTHGFELHCSPAEGPNNLEVNWGKGKRFHLDALTSASCSDDPSLDERPPVAGFDTYVGSGTGRYNGVPGASATWTFTDGGEPGRNDSVRIVIIDAGGRTVLSIEGNLISGNHQAHPEEGPPGRGQEPPPPGPGRARGGPRPRR